MKLPFHTSAPAKPGRIPQYSKIPTMQFVEVAAKYRATRVGGDYFDFHTEPGRLLFLLMDIAGKRESALHIAAAAQDIFRNMSHDRFSHDDAEDATVLTDMVIAMNKAVITEAGGVCHAPCFFGCYQEEIHVLTYINAGHTPAVLRDADGIHLLAANGIPLGLFSHSTHDSQFCALTPNSCLAVVSRGLVETRTAHNEFGVEGVTQHLSSHEFNSAQNLCDTLLESVDLAAKPRRSITASLHIPGAAKPEPNDATVLALRRNANV